MRFETLITKWVIFWVGKPETCCVSVGSMFFGAFEGKGKTCCGVYDGMFLFPHVYPPEV